MHDDTGAQDQSSPAAAFADLIREYMWMMRRPPITANKLAGELGISRQTVVNWLNGARPTTEMLRLVHQQTNIPLARLYASAGYDVLEADPQSVVERVARMSPEERERLRAALNAVDSYLREHAASESEDASAQPQPEPRPKRDSGPPKLLAGVR